MAISYQRLLLLGTLAANGCNAGMTPAATPLSETTPVTVDQVPVTGSPNSTQATSPNTLTSLPLPPAAPALNSVISVDGGGAYSRLAHLADGTWLLSVTRFSNGSNVLTVLASNDHGFTWSPRGIITTGVGNIDNIHMLQIDYTAPGAQAPRLLAAFRNHTVNSAGVITVMRITVCHSDDAGATWAFHSEVENSAPVPGLWEPFLFTTPSHVLQIYYAREYSATDQDIVMHESTDGGLTWGPMITVAGAGIVSRDGMPGVALIPDGMIAIFETGTDKFRVNCVISHDNGKTWVNRALVYDPPANGFAGAPQVVTTTDGTLVASFMTDEDAAVHNWPNDAATKVVVAHPVAGQALSWGQKLTVAPAVSFWPGLLADDDGSYWATYDYNGIKIERLKP